MAAKPECLCGCKKPVTPPHKWIKGHDARQRLRKPPRASDFKPMETNGETSIVSQKHSEIREFDNYEYHPILRKPCHRPHQSTTYFVRRLRPGSDLSEQIDRVWQARDKDQTAQNVERRQIYQARYDLFDFGTWHGKQVLRKLYNLNYNDFTMQARQLVKTTNS